MNDKARSGEPAGLHVMPRSHLLAALRHNNRLSAPQNACHDSRGQASAPQGLGEFR